MLMCSIKYFVIILISMVIVSSEGLNEPRQSRIFSFNSDAEDVEVGMDFSIPFLKIPIKKAFNAVAEFGLPGLNLSKININPMALVLSGLIIISTSIFAPILSNALAWHHLDRSSRINAEHESNGTTLYIAEKLFANSHGCPERVVCWSSQRLKNPEVTKTLKEIMSNKLLSRIINTTALEIAAARGRAGHNCQSYTPCPIDEKSLPKLIRSFYILGNLKSRDQFS